MPLAEYLSLPYVPTKKQLSFCDIFNPNCYFFTRRDYNSNTGKLVFVKCWRYNNENNNSNDTNKLIKNMQIFYNPDGSILRIIDPENNNDFIESDHNLFNKVKNSDV